MWKKSLRRRILFVLISLVKGLSSYDKRHSPLTHTQTEYSVYFLQTFSVGSELPNISLLVVGVCRNELYEVDGEEDIFYFCLMKEVVLFHLILSFWT